ncbi:4Fe-4S dicluster domain-containing protein [Cytobacillus sp. IB215665]|uniref:4Fe-4S dicluster domain-containing protein n=1 Tax=Cytobacillus sp. IB215665 TaxID=3097357 RepID=UPI002A0BA823|nr:4Fe-4S dicluster domain-containing protein [Cytobacillus sp. IB215665]MDX8366850.1 4Fe-4S dicluster domain-containing protein [Cytobacillus sp. IB215665]
MTEKMTRRSFFSLNISSTIGFIGNFIAPQIEQERDFIRPPGAENELAFLTSCTRCGICKDICPESTISLFSMKHGAKLTNTPYLDPNDTACTFCEKCIDHCPTSALSKDGLMQNPAIGKAEIKQQNCLAFREVMCDYCVRSCPIDGALTIIDGKPKVDDKLCNGCGLCVSSCIQQYKGIFVNTI